MHKKRGKPTEKEDKKKLNKLIKWDSEPSCVHSMLPSSVFSTCTPRSVPSTTRTPPSNHRSFAHGPPALSSCPKFTSKCLQLSGHVIRDPLLCAPPRLGYIRHPQYNIPWAFVPQPLSTLFIIHFICGLIYLAPVSTLYCRLQEEREIGCLC